MTNFSVWTSSGLAQGSFGSLVEAKEFAAQLAAFYGVEVTVLDPGVSILDVPMTKHTIFIMQS
jgi:hypothetical protein